MQGQFIQALKDVRAILKDYLVDVPSVLKCTTFAQMVASDLRGHHVEIGAAYGFSALFVLMLKDRIGGAGDVYSIDNFSATSGMAMGASPEKFWSNIKHFGYENRVNLFVGDSNPWPLSEMKFKSGYIDGSHLDDMPLIDFLNMRKRVTGQILFDDAMLPAVKLAVMYALAEGKWSITSSEGWSVLLNQGIRI